MPEDTYEIVPFERVGPVEFGMTRAELDAAGLGTPWVDGERPRLMFREHLFVGFDGSERVKWVEVTPPASAWFDGVRLHDVLDEVTTALARRGLPATRGRGEFEGSTYVEDAGILLWCEDPGWIETVTATRRDSVIRNPWTLPPVPVPVTPSTVGDLQLGMPWEEVAERATQVRPVGAKVLASLPPNLGVVFHQQEGLTLIDVEPPSVAVVADVPLRGPADEIANALRQMGLDVHRHDARDVRAGHPWAPWFWVPAYRLMFDADESGEILHVLIKPSP